MKLKDYEINPALLVIDVQNGFVSKGGSYDLSGIETSHYRQAIPKIEVWLKGGRVNSLIFGGIDTSICVETSLREAFNVGYDIILVSDATASSNRKHYELPLENLKDYYGIVIELKELYQYLHLQVQ